jgi:hypothetical protein
MSVDALLARVTGRVEVELVTTLGTVRMSAAELTSADGAPNPLATLLRPRATVYLDGTALYSVAPAGEPTDGPPLRPILLAVGVVAVALLLVRVSK